MPQKTVLSQCRVDILWVLCILNFWSHINIFMLFLLLWAHNSIFQAQDQNLLFENYCIL